MRTRSQARKGATLVETAVVLGLTFLILMAIMEYGRYMMVRHVVDNAAREGARLAAVSTNNPDTALITTRVEEKLANQLNGATIEVFWMDSNTGANVGAWHEAPFGAGIGVRVTSTYHPMVPTFGILPDPMTVSAVSIMRSEDNR